MHKPDYTDTHAFSGGEHEEPDDWREDDENWTRKSAEHELQELQARYPGDMTSRSLLLTPPGNWMETTAHHGALITDLLVRLLAMTEPHTDKEREAMEALLAAMTPQPASEETLALVKRIKACETTAEIEVIGAELAADWAEHRCADPPAASGGERAPTVAPNPNDPDDYGWDEERQSEAASRRGPTPYTPPRYDDVFAAGVAALDEAD